MHLQSTIAAFLGMIAVGSALAVPNFHPASTTSASSSTEHPHSTSTSSSKRTSVSTSTTHSSSPFVTITSSSHSSSSIQSTTTKASTSASSTAVCGTTTIATFDNLPTTAVTPLQIVGLYDGLYFNLDLLTTGLPELGIGTVTGVVPKTAPNVASFGIIGEVLHGTPEITTLQTGTSFSTFDLDSFYFGCALDTAAGAVGAPASCTISVVGSKAGIQVAQQFFTFTVALGTLSQPMALASAAGFTGVDTVNFTVAVATGQRTAVAVLIDNVAFNGCK